MNEHGVAPLATFWDHVKNRTEMKVMNSENGERERVCMFIYNKRIIRDFYKFQFLSILTPFFLVLQNLYKHIKSKHVKEDLEMD